MAYDHSNDKVEHDRILDRLIELYDDKSRTFQRSFVLLLAFSIIFLFLIFIPYASILEENRQIVLRLSDVSKEITTLQYDIKNIKMDLDGVYLKVSELYDISSAILKKQADTIMTISRNIAYEYDFGSSFPIYKITYDDNSIIDKCINFSTNNSVKCIVEKFDVLFNDTMNNVYTALKKENKSTIPEELNPLNQTIKETLSNKNVTILNDTTTNASQLLSQLQNYNFGPDVDTKLSSMRGVQASMIDMQKLYSESTSILLYLTKEIKEKTKESNRLDIYREQLLQNKTLLQNKKSEIAERLDEIQFPFAKLPLRLDDAIMIFPILLAIGFVLCIHLLYKTVHLRRYFHSMLLKINFEKIKLNNNDILLLAPLWVDPLDSKLNQVIRFTIIIIPFVIFLIVWYLIINYLILDESNLNIPLNPDQSYYWIYNIFYLVSLMLFIYGCWKLIKELHNY